jgi:carboxyl-terminal processing protease
MIAPLEVLELSAFAEQLKREGAARLVLPGHSSDIHQGRLVILTDGQTASTAESFTYLLQRNGALVVGEQTAGAMLSAEFFPLDETFKLFVPVADYVAPDLVRLDGRGVMPDIEIAADQALERALAEITARENSH